MEAYFVMLALVVLWICFPLVLTWLTTSKRTRKKKPLIVETPKKKDVIDPEPAKPFEFLMLDD